MIRIRKTKRVLVWCDYRCATGFATVSTNILAQIKKHYRYSLYFDIVAINWYGDPVPDDYEVKKSEAGDIKEVEEMVDGEIKKVRKRIKVYEDDRTAVWSAYYHDGKDDIYGRHCFLSLINQVDYSLVFIIQDIGVAAGPLQTIRQIRKDKKNTNSKKFKIIYYFPKDSEAILPGWFDHFDVPDRLVAYTHFAKEKAIDANQIVAGKIKVIYHGVDTATFKKLDIQDIASFRKAYFGDNANKTIISNVNRNQFRKDIPTTIFGFKKYKERYNSSAFLYLHMNPEDLQGWNLITVMAQMGLTQGVDYMFMPPAYVTNPPDPGFVNCIYNASDVYLTTTTGEGFGLTIIEAMMAQCPVIAPYNTAIMEVSGNVPFGDDAMRIFTLEESSPHISRFDNIIRPVCDADEVANKIDMVVENKIWTQQVVANAHNWARHLSWNSIGKYWVDEFKKLL